VRSSYHADRQAHEAGVISEDGKALRQDPIGPAGSIVQ